MGHKGDNTRQPQAHHSNSNQSIHSTFVLGTPPNNLKQRRSTQSNGLSFFGLGREILTAGRYATDMLGRRRMTRVTMIVLAATGLLVVWLWLTVSRIPSYYQPPRVEPGEYQDVRDDLEASFNQLNLAVQGDEAFEYEIEQDRLNRWIATREQIWPGIQEYVPEAIERPMVIFQQDRIVLSGKAPAAGFQSILSLIFSVDAEPGQLLVRLEGCRVGAMPVPRHALGRFLDRLAAESDTTYGRDLRALLDGLGVPNELEWRSGTRLLRVDHIRIEPGRMVAKITPGPDRHRKLSGR
jgi:hypothetical protein